MTDAAPSPRKLLVHHHFFKNAGSSLDRALEKAFGSMWATYESGDPAGRLTFEDVRGFLDERPDVAALSSHQLLPQRSADGYELFPIVIVREPISRVRSAYLFEWQKQLGLDEPKGTLAEYINLKLEPRRESVIGDFQISRLSEYERRVRNQRNADHGEERALRLGLATEFLDRVPVFGLVEDFATFIRLLNLHLGSFDTAMPLLDVFEVNVLQGTGIDLTETHDLIRTDIGQGLYDELLARNSGDIELYETARTRFDRLAAGLFPDPPPTADPIAPILIDVSEPSDGPDPFHDDQTAELGGLDDDAGADLRAAEDLTGEVARLERRAAWQQDFLQRMKSEQQQEREQLDTVQARFIAAHRRAIAAESTEPDTPEGVLPQRKVSRLVKAAKGAVEFAERAVGYAERQLLEYPVSPEHQHLRAKIAGSGLFDVEFYKENCRDVIDIGWDPIDHYLIHGGREGRPASELFDTGWYLHRYPDVAQAGWHPLIHYIDHGEREGRKIRGVGDAAYGPEPGYEAFGVPGRDQMESMAAALSFPDLADGEVEISIVVPIYNAIDYTLACLQSLTELTTRYRFEVVVMDDCSDDPDVEVLTKIAGLRYHRNEENLGFLGTCNRAADVVRGEYMVLLNNDTRVDSAWLDALRRTFDNHEGVGIVGSKLVYPDGRLQEAGGIVWEDAGGWNFGRLDDPNHPRYNFVRDVDYASAAAIMVPSRLFESLGRFDERYVPAYYEDTDLCFAARRAGWRVVYQPMAVVVHYEGVSSGTDLTSGVKQHQATNRMTFAEKWADVLQTHGGNGIEPVVAADRRPIGHVLVIDAVTPMPDRDSGSVDMFNLVTIIRDLGYRVHFLPLHAMRREPGYTERLEQLGIQCVYEPYYNSVSEYLAEQGDRFDTVLLSRVDPAAASIDEVHEWCPSAKILFYTVDLHHLRDQREAELTGDRLVLERAEERERVELELMDRVDATIVLSETERQLLAAKGKQNVEVVPLIRKVSAETGPVFEDRSGVIFIGGFAHPPNVDGVEWLIEEIWPRVRAAAARRDEPLPPLSIVGSNTPEHIWEYAGDGITIHGFVENLRPLFDRSRLSIAPLRYGAGLKGKVATSFDYGVPVVGTSMAFEGMPSEGLEVVAFGCDDPAGLAELVLDLHSDRGLWVKTAPAGRRYVQRHYSLETVATIIGPLIGAHPDAVDTIVQPTAPNAPTELVDDAMALSRSVGDAPTSDGRR